MGDKMKTKININKPLLFLAGVLSLIYVAPAVAQYTPDDFTAGLWHLDNEFGTALSFDGIDDYVEVPYSPSLDITGEITIEAWVYSRGDGRMLKIACKREEDELFYFLGVDLGKLYAGVGDHSTYVVTNKVTDLPLNEWHHVAMAYSDYDDKIWLYMDGELKEEVACTISLVTFPPDLLIGAQYQYGNYYQFFDGVIDEVQISNVARTSFDLSKPRTVGGDTVALWHFDEGAGQVVSDASDYLNDGQLGSTDGVDDNDPAWTDFTVPIAADSSANENHGMIYGASFIDGVFGEGLYFDGVDDYVEVPDSPSLDITGAITIEAWIKRMAERRQTILAKWRIGDAQRSYLLALTADNKVQFWLSPDGTWANRKELTSSTAIGSEWTHIAAVWDETTMRIFINDVMDLSTLTAEIPLFEGTAKLTFGKYEDYTVHPPGYFNGIIDEIRISNAARIPVEIDIKPGSYPNSINLGSGGNVPVAIFSTDYFDATTVDPKTVTLAGANVKLKGKGTPMASFEDVDEDGLVDIVVHVDTSALQLSSTDAEAILEGMTYDGIIIRGVDTVRIVRE